MSTPFLIVFWMPQETAASCFDPGSDDTRRWVVGAAIALGFVLPALFGDRFYFEHVTALANARADAEANATKRRGTGSTSGAFALQVVVLLLSIGAGDSEFYIMRARISEGVFVATTYTQPLRDYVKQHAGALPASIEEIASAPPPALTRAVKLEPDGTIRTVFGEGAGKLAGRSLLMTPKWREREIVGWACRSDDIHRRCLPQACQAAP